jgi:hypothetical protein
MLPPALRFYAFVFLGLAIVSLSIVGALIWGAIGSLLLPLPLLLLSWFFRRMFIPTMTGRTRVQLASLAILYSASALYLLPSNPLGVFVVNLLAPWLPAEVLSAWQQPWGYSLIAQVMACGAIVTLNLVWRFQDVSQPTGVLPGGATVGEDRDFERSLERYCKALVDDLDRYDREVNWSDRDLTPLEAEVETERTRRFRPRLVKDLVRAIRRDQDSETFVVLGDPGSGKSVSLRRLVRVLCHQAKTTGVVPVYVNLREYPPSVPTTGVAQLKW